MKYLKILVIVALVILTGVAVVQAAWSEPGCAAPGCNTPEPINQGAANQVKTGGLGTLGNLSVNGTAYFSSGLGPLTTIFRNVDNYNYIRGATVIADTGGNVGIGMVNPTTKLDVSGDVRTSGSLLFSEPGNDSGIYHPDDGVIRLKTNGQNALSIGPSGDVAVNLLCLPVGGCKDTWPTGSGSAGVDRIVAGQGITINPTGGQGVVTVSTQRQFGGIFARVALLGCNDFTRGAFPNAAYGGNCGCPPGFNEAIMDTDIITTKQTIYCWK